MAHALTEKKAHSYIMLLPEDNRDRARFAVGLDRAIFIAAFADAQFNSYMVEFDTYKARLQSFDVPGKENSAHALSAEAEARSELVLSALDRSDDEFNTMAETCWKQLSVAQDLYTRATKIQSEDAVARKAGIYRAKGDVELLRHRLASSPNSPLAESTKRSAATLVSNAQTYYKGAAQLAMADNDDEMAVQAQQRWLISAEIAAASSGTELKEPPFNPQTAKGDLLSALQALVEEGYISVSVGETVASKLGT